MTKKKEADDQTKKKNKFPPSSPAAKKAKPQLIIKLENNSAKRLMWFNVGLFTVVILILWGWSMKINLSNLNLKKSAEGQLLQRSQAEWDRLFNDTLTAQEQAKKTQQIKDNLKQVITALIASSTTTTTTTSTNNQ